MPPPISSKPLIHEIDWNDPKAKITSSFTVHEACWLNSVNCLYWPTIVERRYLYTLCHVMEEIRTLLGKPIIVHCMIRPDWYNALISGSDKSQHILGKACDFHVRGMSCDAVREILRKNADKLGICIEDTPGSSWVHVDIGDPRPNGGRFFKP